MPSMNWKFNMKTYEIITVLDNDGIKCLKCGMISFNKNDVDFKYCGNCHRFHDLMERWEKLRELDNYNEQHKQN